MSRRLQLRLCNSIMQSRNMDKLEISDDHKSLNLVCRGVPTTPPKGARLKTVYTGVCHADLSFTDGSNLFQRPGEDFAGIVLGHEIAAIIEDLGCEIDGKNEDFKKGDFVVIYPWVGCGNCKTCKTDYTNECKGNPGMSCNFGFGHKNQGGYATHVVVPTLSILLKIPADIPKHIACMLPCSGLTAFTALKKARPFIEGGFSRSKSSKLLLLGVGGVGLWALQLAKTMFAENNIEITVVGVNPQKNQIAKENGADFMVQCKREIENSEYSVEIAKITRNGSYQFDAAIDFVGSSSTFKLALGSLRPSGTLVSVGTYGGNVDVSILALTIMQYSIQGNLVGTLSDLKELIEFVSRNHIQYPTVEYTALKDMNDVFRRFRQGQVNGRVLITFDKDGN